LSANGSSACSDMTFPQQVLEPLALLFPPLARGCASREQRDIVLVQESGSWVQRKE